MADRPILFSAPMVRALLDGRKTQTRRLIKQRGKHPSLFNDGWTDSYILDPGNEDWRQKDIPIKLGDRLWVKETHYITDDGYEHYAIYAEDVRAVADHLAAIDSMQADLKLSDNWARPHRKQRPSIHMPRWASRLTLTVTEVRVERLTSISEEDARAEGVEPSPSMPGWWRSQTEGKSCPTAWDAYGDLWNAINGEGAWQADPWVVAYTFAVEHGNIDQIGMAAA